MIERLTLVTGNENKRQQIKEFLGISLIRGEVPGYKEIQSPDVVEVVRHKAVSAYEKLGAPVVTEDTALALRAWNGFPGTYIDPLLKKVGNEGILKMMQTFTNRDAKATVAIAYFNGQALYVFTGHSYGVISDEVRGDGGFGWDSIFIPAGYDLTRAQMGKKDYDETNPRLVALKKLKEFLENES
jgi:XTP/dITP diphosphohydrolase